MWGIFPLSSICSGAASRSDRPNERAKIPGLVVWKTPLILCKNAQWAKTATLANGLANGRAKIPLPNGRKL